MEKNLGSTLRTRPSLLFRVREPGDSVSWDEFHRLYRKLIYGRARRSGLAHADAEDVAQDVFKRVSQTIQEFDLNPERGSFRGWLMQLTRWRIADKFESLPKATYHSSAAAATDGPRTATIERIPAPEEDDDEWDREWQKHLLDAAMDRLSKRVKPKHFVVFDLYVRQQWPVLRVASKLGINPASVYLVSHRLTKQLKAEVQILQRQLG